MAGSLPSRIRRRERLPSGWRGEALSCIGASQLGRGGEYDTRSMQNPPPPPPPPPSQPPMVPPGQPPMMPPGGGGAMAVPGNLASPGPGTVGGLIDVIILAVVAGLSHRITPHQPRTISR